MISFQRKFIFVHIPKTAGTSVEEVLLPFTEARASGEKSVLIRRNWNPLKGPPWLQHLTAREYTEKGFVASLKDFYTFSFVRNPWERLVSEYKSKGHAWRIKLLGVPWTFENFVLRCLPRWWEDNYFQAHDNFRHILPQSGFLTGRNGAILVDEIFRMENVTVDFKRLTERLGLPPLGLPHRRESPYRDPLDGHRLLDSPLHYSEYYSPEARSFVEKYYRRDIELLGYAFEQGRLN